MHIDLKSWDSYRIKSGRAVRLDAVPTSSTDFCGQKDEAGKELKKYRREIDQLTAALSAEKQRSVLVILQGVDAAGKDGAVRKVFSGVNPQHCRVTSFSEPDKEERSHDYLWRICRAMPARGELGIFNRSQYEDVLVLPARGELSHHDTRARLRQIAGLERTWSENGIVIRKFFLHISRDEQARRFQSRLDTPKKHWKVKESDFSDRQLWDRFRSAYEEALTRTSSRNAPRYIIPADHKWYRDLAIAGIMLSTLRIMRPRWPMPQLDLNRFRL